MLCSQLECYLQFQSSGGMKKKKYEVDMENIVLETSRRR